jgi:hypothetical protein
LFLEIKIMKSSTFMLCYMLVLQIQL